MPRSSTECSTSLLPKACFRRTSIARTSRSSRRAIHRMATSRPMPRWCSPRPPDTNPRALAELIKPKLDALPPVTSVEIAGPGFINLRLTPDAWRDELRTILREGERIRPLARSAITSGSTSNMSRPTRPGRCTWAIAAARWSATASPGCSRRPASASPRNIMSTTPARRSIRSPARCTCGTARRSARTSATSPRACTRAII